jgi:hypothetical protein
MEIDTAFGVFMKQTATTSFIVIGQSGCGKTTDISRCLQSYNYIRPRYDQLQNHESLVTLIANFMTTRTIIDFTNNHSKIIFFDDIEILMAQDRYSNKLIQDLIQGKRCKVICSCASGDEKRAVDIKKISTVFKYSSDPSKGAYYDKNIYDIVSAIFERDEHDICDIEIAISSDPVLIGYLLYDNYRKILKEKNIYSDIELLEIAKRISNLFADMTDIEDMWFSSNEYTFIELASLCKAYIIRLNQRTLLKRENTKNIEIQYTQITSRSAQQYNIHKKYKNELFYTFESIGYIATRHQKLKIRNNVKTPIGFMCSAFAFNYLK